MGKPLPTPDEVAAKWSSRGSAAGGEWVSQAAKSTWKTEAIAGEDNFGKQMQKVISEKRRMKGIEKASDADWQEGIKQNESRFTTGITNSKGKMAEGMSNVLNDIKSAEAKLPKRGPKGSPENFQRSKILGEELHAKAEARKSA